MIETRSRSSDVVATAVVLGAWLAMFVAALVYVAKWGTNVPSWDDWDMIPTMTGHQPVTLNWLWSQHNEHRIAVPRLIMLGLYRVFGHDFRVGMYFNVVVTALLSLTLIVTARRARGGRTSIADAFFPLVLLNWGQGLNFIWGWQVEFYTSTVLAALVLVIALRTGAALTVRRALAAGALLMLLVMCGAHGVALVPAMAAWIGVAGLIAWRGGDRRRAGALIVIAAVLLALVAAYFVGYQPVPYHPKRPKWYLTPVTAMEFLTMSFGPAIRGAWPLSGIAFAALGVVTVSLLAMAAWRDPSRRDRALGLLAFIGAMGCLAMAIGLGRYGFEPRYITLSVPIACAAYLAWVAFGPSRSSTVVPMILLLACVATLWRNSFSNADPRTVEKEQQLLWGVEFGRDLHARLGDVERDVRDGVPPYQIMHRHGPWLHPLNSMIADYLPMLRDAGVGAFTRLRDDPVMRPVPIELRLIDSKFLEKWDPDSRTAHTRMWTEMIFALPRPTTAAGIRLRYTQTNRRHLPAFVQIWWRNNTTGEAWTEKHHTGHTPTGDKANWFAGSYARIGQPTRLDAWPNATFDQIRIDTYYTPGTFRFDELSLLVIDEGHTATTEPTTAASSDN